LLCRHHCLDKCGLKFFTSLWFAVYYIFLQQFTTFTVIKYHIFSLELLYTSLQFSCNFLALHKIKFKLKYICLNKVRINKEYINSISSNYHSSYHTCLMIFQSLKEIIGRKLYKKLKHIRLAFIYTTTFSLIWILYGVTMVWRSFTENQHRTVVNVNPKSPKRRMQSGIERLFLTAHPVIYLYTYHHSRFVAFFKTCRSRFRQQQGRSLDEGNMAVSTIQMETFEASG